MPVLGIVASQISGHLFAPSGAYDSIATYAITTNTASVTFSSIPQTYTHLQIRMIARTNAAAVGDAAIISLNSDTNSNNYTYHEIVGNGATVSAYGSGAPETMQMYSCTGATAAASVFGVGITDLLDYTNTNKYKTQRNLGGRDNNGSGQMRIHSSLWMNTNAITSIALTPSIGTAFVQYSSFALYGIKGA